MKDTVEDNPIAAQVRDVMEAMLYWRVEIEAAMAHADFSHTFDDLALMVINGQLTFFNFDDCFCLTQISVFPQFKTFHFLLAGGEIKAIIDQTDYFKDLASAHGCKYLSFSGRKGFEPVLKKEGWEHKFTTMWLGV